MNVFTFDWRDHRATWEAQGWLHIRDGLDPDFLAAALETVSGAGHDRKVAGRGIQGAKEQFVFEFPPAVDYGAALFDVLAPLCGLRRSTMTLSERHIKAYEPDADPRPTAHKDRFASQIAVGVSLVVPPGSHLVLYPDTDVGENPFLSTAIRDSLEPEQLPEVVLRDAAGVEIHDAPGDVVVFRGSAFWHLRRNSARTVNVYLKFNDFGSDPLGEDPATPLRRARTQALLAEHEVGLLGSLVPVLSRRFESVYLDHRREGWPQRLFANVWGQHPFPIDEDEFALLRAADGTRTVAELVAAVPGCSPAAVHRLARRGALDLLDPA